MATTKWNLDAAHSEVQFKVRHMMVSTVTGHFNKFDATVEMQDDDVSTARVHFTADLSSITTNNEQRDGHLRSGDFFDAENHPQIIFDSTKMEQAGDDYKLHGTLTMRGVSKPVVLDVEYGGVIQDPWGLTRAGFSVAGKLSRKEFGVSWSQVTETGGIVVSDEVKLHANVEFTKEQPAA
ncbi:MAG: YceI family protein [Bacteroidota bacterium]